MNGKILNLLYSSFDTTLTQAEQKLLDEALVGSRELREEKEKIEMMRTIISDSTSKSFKPFFAERVMQRVRLLQQQRLRQVSFFDSLQYIFRPIAIAAIMLIIALMSYNLLKSNHLSFLNVYPEPEVTLEQVLDPTLTLTME